MAILHADNFSIYGTTPALMTQGVYASQNCTLINDPDGISGGKVMNFYPNDLGNNTTPFRYVLQNGTTKKVGLSFRWWHTALPGSNSGAKSILVRDATNTPLSDLYFNSTGTAVVKIYGGLVYETPAPVITANGWYHIEFVYECNDDGTVDFELRIEGLEVLKQDNVVGLLPRPAQISAYSNNVSITFALFMKDFVVWDGTGPRNNDFLGSVLVATLVPDGDVALNWTPVGRPTGSEILRNNPPNDAQYIMAEDLPLPSPFVCELTALPDEVTSVRALITFVRAAKNDGGDGSMQVGLISNPPAPVVGLGANRPITVAQTYWRDVFETDPASGALWLPGSVNSARLQINRTT